MRPLVEVECRPITDYPVAETVGRKRAPFIRSYTNGGGEVPLGQTIDQLRTELGYLKAPRAILEIDLPANQIRNDGWPYNGARAMTPRVVLTLPESQFGPLRYPCDTFLGWENNLRAITLALSALRAVDRYGVTRRGEQYTGWKQLPAAGTATRTTGQAVDYLAALLSWNRADVARDPGAAGRAALKVAHPDAGGNPAVFVIVQECRKVLGV